MIENPNCQLCELHQHANEGSVCLRGEGGGRAKLLIYLDYPTEIEDRRHRSMVSNAVELLRWMLSRMSIAPNEYYIDYVIKCYPKRCKTFTKKADRLSFVEACSEYRIATLQSIRPKSIIAMGRVACEAFTGSSEIKNYEGTSWTPYEPAVRNYVERVWITYSPAYALQDCAESVGIYRVLQHAAIDAQLNPKFNPKIKMFDYGY